MHIAFIGLGHMGQPMAHNLLKAGFPLSVFDVNTEAVDVLVKLGATSVSSIADVVKNADVIITMLQTGQQVSDVCLQENGVFNAVRKNCLFVDCSSIEIDTTKLLHKLAAEKGIAMLDAPVSGGTAGAAAATLTFMVGGSPENFNRAQPILEKMGKKIIHAGLPGTGQAAKICNNLILGISMIGVSEAFTLGEKLGLDPKKFFEISSNASGQCWSMTSYCPVPGIIEKAPSNNNYEPGFMSKMMLKDLRLAQHAAEHVQASLPLGAEAAELYSLFIQQGNGAVDFSGIINLIKGKK